MRDTQQGVNKFREVIIAELNMQSELGVDVFDDLLRLLYKEDTFEGIEDVLKIELAFDDELLIKYYRDALSQSC